MAQETPTSASSSSGQALQLEAFDAAGDLTLEGIDVGLASNLDRPRHARLDEPLALRAVEDPAGQYSPHYDGQNALQLARVPDLAHVDDVIIQTGTSTDQVYEDNSQILVQFVSKTDQGYIVETYNSEDSLEDYTMNSDNNDSDEGDQVDGKSFNQNISSLGTAVSEKRLQQDFSPTATPDDISVTKLTTSSSEPLQKPEKVITELVIQSTGDGANIATVPDEAKEDEVNGGIVLDQMNMDEGGTNKVSSFGAVTDKSAPAAGNTSATTANDVRLAVPSLEPLLKRAKVNVEDDILVNVERTSSSSPSSAATQVTQNSIGSQQVTSCTEDLTVSSTLSASD